MVAVKDSIKFSLPGIDEVKTGEVVEFDTVKGVKMPVVSVDSETEYPVHPDNIEE